MTVQNLLQQAGLDRHEIALYLSLVQLGESNAGKLAKKSGVPRTYVYKILESLSEKGMVRTTDARSIRKYAITDYQAPQRYLEKRQFELYRAQQEAQSLAAQLETMANPQAPVAVAEQLKNSLGWDDFWKLLHSTITREIWIVNPPQWWGSVDHSSEVKKWEQFRQKQHVWEKRFAAEEASSNASHFTENKQIKALHQQHSSLILIDHYHIQVTSWDPFRALRVESGEMVNLLKGILEEGLSAQQR